VELILEKPNPKLFFLCKTVSKKLILDQEWASHFETVLQLKTVTHSQIT